MVYQEMSFQIVCCLFSLHIPETLVCLEPHEPFGEVERVFYHSIHKVVILLPHSEVPALKFGMICSIFFCIHVKIFIASFFLINVKRRLALHWLSRYFGMRIVL